MPLKGDYINLPHHFQKVNNFLKVILSAAISFSYRLAATFINISGNYIKVNLFFEIIWTLYLLRKSFLDCTLQLNSILFILISENSKYQ
ncbi:hypothetical protein HNR53_004349 [Bacillus benzoevorans]|uniref:Uncharacterized protein n=1 Tax=Bacillus benzoevorans TaxID=1456 RepID=A0A7X0HVQ9_9BACI|nr:hypothetical protein [Bacillus benzoevorans]